MRLLSHFSESRATATSTPKSPENRPPYSQHFYTYKLSKRPPKSQEELLEEAHRIHSERAAANVKYERLLIQKWGHEKRSSTGEKIDVTYNDLSPSDQACVDNGEVISEGGSGIVKRTRHRGVFMAQMCIRVPLSSNREARAKEVAKLKEEGNIDEKLASHRHIITLVGTY